MNRITVIALAIGMFLIAVGVTLVVLPANGNAETQVQRSAAPTATAAPSNGLPTYQLPSGGVLTPLNTLPSGAMSGDEVIRFLFVSKFGPTLSDSFRQQYPAHAVSALYSAVATSAGLAAENQPVWVVIIDGWGPPPALESPGTRYKAETVLIVDAVTGAPLASWAHGQILQN